MLLSGIVFLESLPTVCHLCPLSKTLCFRMTLQKTFSFFMKRTNHRVRFIRGNSFNSIQY